MHQLPEADSPFVVLGDTRLSFKALHESPPPPPRIVQSHINRFGDPPCAPTSFERDGDFAGLSRGHFGVVRAGRGAAAGGAQIGDPQQGIARVAEVERVFDRRSRQHPTEVECLGVELDGRHGPLYRRLGTG